MSQLRNLINRRNIVTKVARDYHAVSQFIDLVTDCHVLAAAMEHLGMVSVDSQPSNFPRGVHLYPADRKKVYLQHIVGTIVDRFVYSNMNESIASQQAEDHIFSYATGLLKFGLVRRVTVMTTAAGDGERCMRNWRYSMVVFHQTHKVKYQLEAFLLQASVTALLPPRLSQQVMWNRFVNLSGGEGHNLDGDYVMELLNRLAKTRIKSLGPNHTPKVVDRIGKTVMFCSQLEQHMTVELDIPPTSRKHTSADLANDRRIILDELRFRSHVFQYLPGRNHVHFPEFPTDIFSTVNVPRLHKWLCDKKVEYRGGKSAF